MDVQRPTTCFALKGIQIHDLTSALEWALPRVHDDTYFVSHAIPASCLVIYNTLVARQLTGGPHLTSVLMCEGLFPETSRPCMMCTAPLSGQHFLSQCLFKSFFLFCSYTKWAVTIPMYVPQWS